MTSLLFLLLEKKDGMSDEAALQKEADEAFRSSVGTRFASADERTAVVTLCARSSVQCGLRPAALVRRWEAHTLNARVAGPVTLKAFAAFVQTLRHQTASTLAATTPGTAPARASPYAPSEFATLLPPPSTLTHLLFSRASHGSTTETETRARSWPAWRTRRTSARARRVHRSTLARRRAS